MESSPPLTRTIHKSKDSTSPVRSDDAVPPLASRSLHAHPHLNFLSPQCQAGALLACAASLLPRSVGGVNLHLMCCTWAPTDVIVLPVALVTGSRTSNGPSALAALGSNLSSTNISSNVGSSHHNTNTSASLLSVAAPTTKLENTPSLADVLLKPPPLTLMPTSAPMGLVVPHHPFKSTSKSPTYGAWGQRL